jgi:hypothetical protein
MKNKRLLSLGAGATFLIATMSFLPLKAALADQTGDKADYQRKINKQIDDLKLKIDEAREDYKKDGMRVNNRIKEYEDRIAEIKREADAKINSTTWNKDDRGDENRVSNVRQNFQEWRFNRMINNYEEEINDLRDKSKEETNADRKRDLDEKITKLEAKHNAAKAKLVDLRATNGENWDKIQQELDQNLKEIDHDFDDAKRAN